MTCWLDHIATYVDFTAASSSERGLAVALSGTQASNIMLNSFAQRLEPRRGPVGLPIKFQWGNIGLGSIKFQWGNIALDNFRSRSEGKVVACLPFVVESLVSPEPLALRDS